MSRTTFTVFILSLFFIVGAYAQAQSSSTAQTAGRTYHIDQTFRIGGEGGWDHLTIDPQSKLLYISRGAHTMVVDATSGKSVADITGQKRNHDVAVVPSVGRGFISDSQDASVTIFDLKTNKVLGKVKDIDNADGLIYDPNCGKVLVSCGESNKLAVISPDVDPQLGKAETMVSLDGRSRYLAADKTKIYVNLFDKDQVAVIESKTMKVIRNWPTTPGGTPVGMAIDPVNHRLFIGCRKPQKLIVMSSEDGKVLADLPLGAATDSLQFDGDIFASSRDGTLTVARETSPSKFEIVQTLKTKRGAKTMALDPITHTLYLPTAKMVGGDKMESRPVTQPDSFMILVVGAAGK